MIDLFLNVVSGLKRWNKTSSLPLRSNEDERGGWFGDILVTATLKRGREGGIFNKILKKMNSKMKLIKEYKWHLILLLIYLGLNSWIYITWITREFDSDFVGGIERTLLVASNLFMNVVFFIILSIIGQRKKEFRKLYIITSLLSLVSIGLLILTSE